MINDINIRIEKLKEELYLKKKWEKHLTDSKNRKHELQRRLEEYHAQWKKEKKDVEKLEKISLVNIFASISGKKYEKLDKEKQEETSARLKYENQTKELAAIENEIKELYASLASVNNPLAAYNELLQEKENYLKMQGSPVAVELFQMDEKIADMNLKQKEIDEAILAGNRALSLLDSAISTLDEAKGWSTWDMFGGGVLSTAMKHSSLNRAEDCINDAQNALRRFQMELEDINEFFVSGVRLDGFMTFADYFFDGLFVDWTIHGKINNSMESTVDTYNKVNEMVEFLQKERSNTVTEIEEMKTERANLIEQA